MSMSWWWVLHWVLRRLSLSLLKWSPLLPKSFGLVHLSLGEPAPAATPASLTSQPPLGSARPKWRQRRKWSQVSARAGSACYPVLPPFFYTVMVCKGPLLPFLTGKSQVATYFFRFSFTCSFLFLFIDSPPFSFFQASTSVVLMFYLRLHLWRKSMRSQLLLTPVSHL